jgi:fluoroacetyl-CoA thioesterase
MHNKESAVRSYRARHSLLKPFSLILRIIIVISSSRVKVLGEFAFTVRLSCGGRRPKIVTKPGASMKQSPRMGLTGELSIAVGPENRISFADGRMPAVLATPWLVAYLEYAARDAIAPLLEADERSVGTFIEVEHLGPAPEGFTVKCRARVIHVDGSAVTFQVDAHDGVEVIAKGIHRRRVIDIDRFARRVEKKRAQLNNVPQ